MSIITFEQRRARMTTPEDVNKEINLAAAYAKSLHTKAKTCQGTLAEKLAIKDNAKKADEVTRKLKLQSFDIEDELRAESLTH
ncbi:hypothetical protein NI385_25660 (plasmid) [Vibrio parahaemolyticus]|uniref:Uncharacterized protein n=4 Tax=Vibrio TaxID=662 RepID=A0A9X0R9G8_VIBME|nr:MULTISPECIES: hypothetical protein [Vibrio]EJG0764730.1 hypothetical protein [Vibrio parahaemolyticus O5:K30]MCA2471375.1 hypothetical protein [Vibrio alginolyticus]MCS0328178.1 hypothetical protein [Vibrio diabolicus]TVN08320.1 hypothetical protein FPV63_04560 [Vibrio cholerae]ARN69523.1 hypothetical protein FORC36_5006 [Vibrio vulnificus]